MVRVHLQIGQHIHQKTGVVLVVRDNLDQGHQSLFLFDECTSLERGDEVAGLRGLDHGVIVDDEVTSPDLVLNWHIDCFFPTFVI